MCSSMEMVFFVQIKGQPSKLPYPPFKDLILRKYEASKSEKNEKCKGNKCVCNDHGLPNSPECAEQSDCHLVHKEL